MVKVQTMKKRTARICIVILLCAGIFLSVSGTIDSALQHTGIKKLAAANNDYLETSFDHTIQLFMALSAIKLGLAVIEGSQAGVSLGVNATLQVGDVVQAVYDYIHIAWKTVLAGAVILWGIKNLLAATTQYDQLFLTITLVVLLTAVVLGWLAPSRTRLLGLIKEVCGILALVTAMCYLLLPFSLYGASVLSQKITQPAALEAEKSIIAVQKQLDRHNAPESLWSTVENLQAYINTVSGYLQGRLQHITVSIIKIIAGYLFDCIVFPLGLFLLLFWITRTILNALVNPCREYPYRQNP